MWVPQPGRFAAQACAKVEAMSLIEPIFAALNGGGVRYVVVGGVATVLHGYARLTVDIDLVVDLAPDEALKAMDVLSALGLQPRVPVKAAELANRASREQWKQEKNMTVFPLVDRDNPLRQVDVFVDPPIDFESLWQRAETIELATTTVRVASIPDLIAMKRIAGRPHDLADIDALTAILAARKR